MRHQNLTLSFLLMITITILGCDPKSPSTNTPSKPLAYLSIEDKNVGITSYQEIFSESASKDWGINSSKKYYSSQLKLIKIDDTDVQFVLTVHDGDEQSQYTITTPYKNTHRIIYNKNNIIIKLSDHDLSLEEDYPWSDHKN